MNGTRSPFATSPRASGWRRQALSRELQKLKTLQKAVQTFASFEMPGASPDSAVTQPPSGVIRSDPWGGTKLMGAMWPLGEAYPRGPATGPRRSSSAVLVPGSHPMAEETVPSTRLAIHPCWFDQTQFLQIGRFFDSYCRE